MVKKQAASPAAHILNILGIMIMVLAVALCLVLAVPKFMGYSGYTVLTGSMEPTIPVGSVVYAKEADPASLVPGDIIVFYSGSGDIPVTHRIVKNDTSAREVTTRGDANDLVDVSPVPYSNIIGVVTRHVPGLGRLLAPLGTLLGKIGMIALIFAGALMCDLARRLPTRDS
ncbi:MAG: signal peptidase I [Firmicutes bacterium]|nr:signal peptidase I [Bacillota bacterium]